MPADGDSPVPSGPATYFAPAERDTAAEIRRKADLLQGISMLGEVLDAMPGPVMLLNANRQIVDANQSLLDLLDAALAEVVEKRPGEVLGCIRAQEGPGGCGTDRHCVTCGRSTPSWSRRRPTGPR
jgi:PAS domain-containing protein